MGTKNEFIRSILQEEQRAKEQHKKRKAHEYESKKAERKGKTLGEWERDEGGPIQESQVAMAHSKRSARRGEATGADTRILGVKDLEKAEQDLTVAEEDGIKIEPFNLKEERERGHFDEGGNYVENAKESDEEEEDAWLKSGEASIVSEEVRRRLEEREKRERTADDDQIAPPAATQIARLQLEAARLLEPEETLAAGLRRLAKKVPKGAKQPTEEKARFDRLTELGSLLMDAGEMDVYTQTNEYFARAAAVYIDEDEVSSSLFASGLKSGGTAAYEEADEDMFGGNSDEENLKPEEVSKSPKGVDYGATKTGRVAGPQGAPNSQATEDFKAHYTSWPIKELRRFLTERGVDASSCVEKDDLINRVVEVATAEAQKTVNAPAGYSLDAASGYYYSAESGLYWDPKSGGYYDGQSGKWFSWDSSTQQFVEWK